MASDQLADRVAIVTGASSGIGSGIAKRLGRAGAKVIVNYNSTPEGAEATVTEIRRAGGAAEAVRGDASDPGQISSLFDAAEASFGRVTLLVNNAAVRGDPSKASDITLEQYQRVFGANVKGPVMCIGEFARRAPADGGRIVNITSGQARTPMPGSGLYAGSKGAMESITRAFAADLGPSGITVNAVAPGATATETFLAAIPEHMQQQTIADTALGRLGTPADIADVVAFLLSDDAHWVTGQILDANGGLRRG